MPHVSMLTMGTSTLKWVFFAFLIQVTVALPSFGTGNQIEKWNEVDDEHPGEILPRDYMMPMRDPNGSTDDKTTEKSESPAPDNSPASSALSSENNLINPVPGKKVTTEMHQSLIAPVNSDDVTATSKTAPDSLSKPQENKPELKASEKLTVTSNQPLTDDNIPKPVPERLTTVRPHTRSVYFNVGDKTEETEKAANSLSKPQQNEHNPFIVVRIRSLPHDELPAPSPTPRPPTEEEDCECVECEEEIEKLKSGVETDQELDCQDGDISPPYVEKESSMEIKRENRVLGQSPLSLLQTGKEGESLEDIFNDVLKVMSRMTLSDKENLVKSIPFSQIEEENMGIKNEKEIPTIIAKIMMKTSKVISNNEDDAPFNINDSENQEQYFKNRVPSIKLSSFNRENKEPMQDILLRSLLPRHTLAPEDLLEIMKNNRHNSRERKMITSLNDIFKNPVKNTARFVALQNEGYTSRLPPLRFPEENVQSITREPELTQIPIIIKTRGTDNEFVSRLINSLRPAKISSESSSPFSSLDAHNEHLQKFDPQMKSLMNILLKQMAEHEMSNGVPESVNIVKNLEDIRFSK